jgi:hypothetical protein
MHAMHVCIGVAGKSPSNYYSTKTLIDFSWQRMDELDAEAFWWSISVQREWR